MAGDAVADGFAAHAVFLRREVEGNIVGLVDTGKRGGASVEIGGADGEGDVPEAKGV
jgi:hypothetical protein